MHFLSKLTSTVATIIMLVSCSARQADKPADTVVEQKEQTKVLFNADSAMSYIKKQTDLGPRNPGSEAHRLAAAYLAGELKRHNPDTLITNVNPAVMPDGKKIDVTNIMGRWGTDKKSRILLLAHYDTRPVADRDPDPANRDKPIVGANDGASGVGVLLEVARLINQSMPQIGIDILFVDAEDSGNDNDEDSWCIGSQQWVRQMPYGPREMPRFAILLDMVGGRNAKFHREYFSDLFARQIVDKIWSTASVSGFASRFPNEQGGAITDDHVVLNRAGIKTVDIIESKNPQTGSFNPTWHTLDDNFRNIDRSTIEAVGQVVVNTIVNEKQ